MRNSDTDETSEEAGTSIQAYILEQLTQTCHYSDNHWPQLTLFMRLKSHRHLLSFLIGILTAIYIPQPQYQKERNIRYPDDEEFNPHIGIPKCATLICYHGCRLSSKYPLSICKHNTGLDSV